MGLFSAIGVATSDTDIKTQLRWHLTSNHYPPLPESMVEPCIEAINAYKENDMDKLIKLPEDMRWKNQDHAPVRAILEDMHLDAWLIDYQAEDEPMTDEELELLVEKVKSVYAQCDVCLAETLVDELYVEEQTIYGICNECLNTVLIPIQDFHTMMGSDSDEIHS